jgi:transcriptional regulator with XRE-family HTH domain
MRELRQRKGITQRALAQAIGVTPAYLSALEHGRRGRPTFELLQRIAGYFNIIWDEAEDLFRLADASDPRVVVDTAGLAPEYTLLANELSKRIRTLPPDVVDQMIKLLKRRQ